MRLISQREAKKLKKRVAELEGNLQAQRRAYASEWPSSTVVARITPGLETLACIRTARKLNHAVVAVIQNDTEIAFFADELPK